MKGRTILFLTAGVFLMAVLFIAFRQPAPSPALAHSPEVAPIANPSGPLAEAPTIRTVAATDPAVKKFVFQLLVKGNKLVDGPAVISVREGDVVAIVVTADTADELHLHGYDVKIDLKPNTPGRLEFKADRTGRFEYELEQSRVELGALEVQPR